MPNDKLAKLIEKAMIAQLADKVLAALAQRQKSLILLFADSAHQRCPALQSSLLQLAQAGYRLTVLFSPAALSPQTEADRYALARVIPNAQCFAANDLTNEALAQHIRLAQHMVIVGLSTTILAKAALGISDCLTTQLIQSALLSQQSLWLMALDPALGLPTPHPTPYQQLFLGYLTRLHDIGAHLISPEMLFSSLTQPADNASCPAAFGQKRTVHLEPAGPRLSARPLVSLQDVLLHDENTPLIITSNTLITPAAHDEIQRRHIMLINPH